MKLASFEHTHAWGLALAATLEAGAVVALVGNLGAGKTHAAKGLVEGLGSPAVVSSPTFTLVHEYGGGRVPVFHFDFYRIESPEEVLGIGWDDYLDARGVVIVEWADKFAEIIPVNARWFQFAILDDGTRGVEEVQGSRFKVERSCRAVLPSKQPPHAVVSPWCAMAWLFTSSTLPPSDRTTRNSSLLSLKL